MEDKMEKEVKFYRIIDSGINLFDCFTIINGGLPLNGLEEINEQDYLLDNTGNTICYGGDGVVEKVKLKFGLSI